jgi:hypothetical protein
MTTDLWLKLLSVGLVACFGVQAWKRKNRRGVIDALLIGGVWLALLLPENLTVIRYGLVGTLLAILLVRLVMFDLIKGTDKYARAMAIGMLVFVVSLIPALSMAPPVAAWAKYLAVAGGVTMMATLLWPLIWMTRILFSAYRLSRDLKHSRPPREADEQTLGIDLSVLRQPRD